MDKRYSQKYLDENNAQTQVESRRTKREMREWQDGKFKNINNVTMDADHL